MSQDKQTRKINFKRLTNLELEKLVIDVIKNDHIKQSNILDVFFNKFKIKPHKKLNNDMSFIECCLYYKKYDLLNKHVSNLNMSVPNYNIINVCVFANNPNLLKQYIKIKNININQLIDGETPITIAIKNKYVECFDILIENNANIYNVDGRYYTTFFIIIEQILNDHEKEILTNEKIDIYLHMLNLIFPVTFSNSSEKGWSNELTNLLNLKTMYKSVFANHLLYYHNINDESFGRNICKEAILNGSTRELIEKKNLLLPTERNILFKKILRMNNLSFDGDDLVQIRKLLIANLDIFVNFIINRRPHLLIIDECIVSKSICSLGNSSIVKNLFDNHDVIVTKLKCLTYTLIKGQRMDYVKQMIDTYPDLSESNEKKLIIFMEILESDMSDDDKIKNIMYFISKGFEITCRSNPLQALDIAMSSCSDTVIEFLLNISDKSIHTYLITAIQYERFNIFKLLVESGCELYFNSESNPKPINFDPSNFNDNDFEDVRFLPMCVMFALKAFNYDIIKYIVESPIFNLNRRQINYMYDFATSINSPDIILNLMLKIINPEYQTINRDEKINFNLLRLKGLFTLYIPTYDEDKKEILLCCKVIILLLFKVINEPEKKLYKDLAFYDEQRFAKEHSDFMFDEDVVKRCCLLIETYLKLDVKLQKKQSIFNLCNDVITENLRPVDELPNYKKELSPYNEQIQSMVKLLDELFNDAVIEIEQEEKKIFINYLEVFDSCNNTSTKNKKKKHSNRFKKSLNKPLSKASNEILSKLHYKLSHIISNSKLNDTLNDSLNDEQNNEIFNEPINEPINEPTNESTNELINESINEPINELSDNLDDELSNDPNYECDNEITNELNELNANLKNNINANNLINNYNDTSKQNKKTKINNICIPEEFIKSHLSLLVYPFKMNNYNFLKEKISNENISMIEKDNEFIFFKNSQKVAIIYKNKYKNNVPVWFTKYGYNIGIDTKQDDNHMFPFGIDYYVHKIWEKCIIKCKTFQINDNKKATLLYFKGILLKDNEYIEGNYEYFINHKGMLFHRLFKEFKKKTI